MISNLLLQIRWKKKFRCYNHDRCLSTAQENSNHIAYTETGSSYFMGSMPEKCTVRKWNSQSCLEVSFFFSCQYLECENFEDNFSYFFPVRNV